MAELTIDPDSLTFGEVIEFEKITGSSIAVLAGGQVSGLAMAAFTLIVLRRDDPDLTLDDVLDMKITSTLESGNGATPDPTPAAEQTGG